MRKIILVSAMLALTACGSSNNNRVTPTPVLDAQYEVNAVNLTLGQPLSPLAVFIRDSSEKVFSVGSPASVELERLAESGDNSTLLTAIESVAEISGAAPLGPGASETLTLAFAGSTAGMHLSIVSMLVNTNDAITAVNAVDISGLAVGESATYSTVSYDAGTEANTETAATIPGPAGGGEGFNAIRDDIRDQVMMHSGVVTAADGLSSSDLNQQHRWDNPVARFRITRTQ
ncbi:MAG: hypothetical protein ACJA0N_002447 [Pseudohongiellaceae bacterium]|jgi:hypothetical protein